MRFSHSSIDQYKECPRKYYLNRIEKLRPIYQNSPLFFGSLVDDIVGRIFLDKKKDLTEEELDLVLNNTPEEMLEREIGKWYEDHLLRFYQSDLDLSLFSEQDLAQCISRCQELDLEVNLDSYEAFLDACKQQSKQDKFALDRECQLGYNSFFIKSLELKTRLFIPVITEWFQNEVEETLSIQEQVKIVDEDDEIQGYIDIKCKMKDGTTRIWDFKTSSKAYKDNQANESQQLTIYSEFAKIRDVGFLVLHKKIRKRVPKVRLQEVLGKITAEQRESCFSEITEVVDKIKSSGTEKEDYPMNKDSCWNWGGCTYKDYCTKGKMDGLEHKEKK